MTTPHRDFEPFENASNLDEDLGLFEAAMHVHRVVLDCPPITGLTLADGDGAAPAARAVAEWFAQRTGTAVGPTSPTAVTVASGAAALATALAGRSGGPTLVQLAEPPTAAPRVAVLASEPDRAGCPASAFALRLAGADGDLALVELAASRTAKPPELALQPQQETTDAEAAASDRSRAAHAAFGSLVAALQHRTPQPRSLHVETRAGELGAELESVLAQLKPDVVVMARVDTMTSAVLPLLVQGNPAPAMVLLV